MGRFTLNSFNMGAQQCTSRRLNLIFFFLFFICLAYPSSVLAAQNSSVCMYIFMVECMYVYVWFDPRNNSITNNALW